MEKTFAERLKEAREAAGMTQKMLAQYMLIPRRTLEDWERGINEPPEYVKLLLLNELERKKEEIPGLLAGKLTGKFKKTDTPCGEPIVSKEDWDKAREKRNNK